MRPARPRLRDRGRGRQHPDRRGADAADHLRASEEAAQTYYTFARLAKRWIGVPHKEKLKSLGESEDTSDADFDYEYDEKHKTVAPTERGVKKAEEFLGVENLYLAENGNLVNHLVQSLKAESLYKKDDDYAVIDGEVMIIDEFTGRILEGRRWSEGLHQAVEAKEGVAIPRRTRRSRRSPCRTTSALRQALRHDRYRPHRGDRVHEDVQNAGGRDPDQPADGPDGQNDQIFKTKDGKWQAGDRRNRRRHQKGQPVLVGTVSVEVSEMISAALKRDGIQHAS